jgi:phage terminase small subunit
MTKKAKRTDIKQSAAQRRTAFANAYLVNGRNITQAAISAGYSKKTAPQQGSRLLNNVHVKKIIEEANKKAGALAGLSVERTLLEVARLAYADPGKLWDEDGNLIPIHLLDADTRATIASIEVDEVFTGKGETKTLAGHLRKIKQHGKAQALDMAMKYHQLYVERHEHKVEHSYAERLARAKQRIKG